MFYAPQVGLTSCSLCLHNSVFVASWPLIGFDVCLVYEFVALQIGVIMSDQNRSFALVLVSIASALSSYALLRPVVSLAYVIVAFKATKHPLVGLAHCHIRRLDIV
jgi:hypothetical protein